MSTLSSSAMSIVRTFFVLLFTCAAVDPGQARSPSPRQQQSMFLVTGDLFDIHRVPLQESGRHLGAAIEMVSDQDVMLTIDVDCRTQRIYWGDGVTHTIRSSAYDGTDIKDFLTEDIIMPYGMSIDRLTGNVYWTDHTKQTVETANLDTKSRKVLLGASDGVNDPGAIVAHPQRREIFWTNHNTSSSHRYIVRASMDGSQRAVLLSYPDVHWVEGLAMDYSTDRLCYTEYYRDTIECVHLDTKQRDTIATDLADPFGLAIHRGTFYWTDNTNKIQYQVDKLNNVTDNVSIPSKTSVGMYGVAVGGVHCWERGAATSPTLDKEFVLRQKKVLSLLKHNVQIDTVAEHYKIGKEYDVLANREHYLKVQVVDEFFAIYNSKALPMGMIFSVFNEKMREEAVALYHLFYYAKDFETFYKTAAWARSALNEGLFVYSFSIAVLHRADTRGIVLPAPYEIYPFFFVNTDVINKLYRVKMQEGLISPETASHYGITYDNNVYTVRANYSGAFSYDNEEQKLSYFTEDIGLNTYYYYFHAAFPFWMKSEESFALKERRGELNYAFYHHLLARYYMERLTNGLGEIPSFSWRQPIKTGYTPNLVAYNLHPFVARNNDYHINSIGNAENIQFLEAYESQFLEYLQQGHFKGYNMEVDVRNYQSINFVDNYWQNDADLYEKSGKKNYAQYYQIIARNLLGAAPEPVDKFYSAPTVLEQHATALRDPVFYQLYKRVMYYYLQYKQYLEPYTKQQLHFTGVKINDVSVDKLVTFFDFFNFDASNAIQRNQAELKDTKDYYQIRMPRLNHTDFNVSIEVKSEVSTDAVVKIFLSPKYDSMGHLIDIEDNWMNFIELDLFKTKLSVGKNIIVRSSDDFVWFKEDSLPTYQLDKMLDSGEVPVHMSENYFLMPERMMLPKGTKGGFPFQLFVVVYPYVAIEKPLAGYEKFFLDNKPLSFPLDRPASDVLFYQPNMYFKDVHIYHEGEDCVYAFNYHGEDDHNNVVSQV